MSDAQVSVMATAVVAIAGSWFTYRAGRDSAERAQTMAEEERAQARREGACLALLRHMNRVGEVLASLRTWTQEPQAEMVLEDFTKLSEIVFDVDLAPVQAFATDELWEAYGAWLSCCYRVQHAAIDTMNTCLASPLSASEEDVARTRGEAAEGLGASLDLATRAGAIVRERIRLDLGTL